MVSTDGYQVDPDEVDGVVRTMFSQIDEFGELSRQFGQLVPPVAAFGRIASPAGLAAATTHELIQRVQQALEAVLNLATGNVQAAMTNYRSTDGGGAAGLNNVVTDLGTPVGMLRRLRSTGLGPGEIHTYLQDHSHQVGIGMAEVYVGSDMSEVRVQPGDLVTTAEVTATVGPDGHPYVNGQPWQPPTGQEARVYRSMTATSANGGAR
jgi:hypothetical protein